MIRFYKTYLGRLLLGLLILIELEKNGGKQAVSDAVARYTPTSPEDSLVVQNALELYISNYPDESPENDEVLKGALGQLKKKRNDDADLLDLIVNALKLPFTGSFGPNALRALRDSVLNPGELTELKKAWKSGAKCPCGHQFTANELASVTVFNDTITIKCSQCSKPQNARCDFCGKLVPLIGKVAASALKEVDCGCRKRAARAANATAPPITSDPANVLSGAAAASFRTSFIKQPVRVYSHGGGRSISQPASPYDYLVTSTPALTLPIADDDDGGF